MSFPACWPLMMLLVFGHAEAPKDNHIQWHFSSLEQSGSEWKLLFTATIDRGWHLYSQSLEPDGPMPTKFTFDTGDGYRLLGETSETGDLKRSYDSTFMVNVVWYEGQVAFTQRVRATSKGEVKGEITYSVCSEELCVPGSVRFSLAVGK